MKSIFLSNFFLPNEVINTAKNCLQLLTMLYPENWQMNDL